MAADNARAGADAGTAAGGEASDRPAGGGADGAADGAANSTAESATSGAAAGAAGRVEPPALPRPYVGPETIPGLVRAVRRRADLSQRELARRTGVSRATVARVESGALTPSIGVLLRLLAAADLVLVATDQEGRVVQPMRVWDETHDGAERRFPAHLDLILDPRGDEWWASVYGLARPPETFHRDRHWRDARRRRSQWEVRVKQHRAEPPPPDPDRDPRWWRRLA